MGNAKRQKPLGKRQGGGKKRDENHPLSPEEELFVHFYVQDLHGPSAVMRANIKVKSPIRKAWQLLQKPYIHAAILKRKKVVEAQGVTEERVLAELANIAFFNLDDAVAWGKDGVQLKESMYLSPSITRAVKSVKEGKDGMSVLAHDKVAALKHLSEVMGMVRKPGDEEDDGKVPAKDVVYETHWGT